MSKLKKCADAAIFSKEPQYVAQEVEAAVVAVGKKSHKVCQKKKKKEKLNALQKKLERPDCQCTCKLWKRTSFLNQAL